MTDLTKLQRLIILLYAGNAYSAYRDNSLTELISKSKAYLDKYSSQPMKQYGGGYALMVMEKVLSGEMKYEDKGINDELKKAWLSIAIGFELTNTSLELPKFLLPIVRLFAAPHIKDKGFSEWVAKYNQELSNCISLINGLENIQKNCDVHQIVFDSN